MKTMQLVSLDALIVEAYRSGGQIEMDNTQDVAYLDVSRTLTMYAVMSEAAS
jgi:hypothetical protein